MEHIRTISRPERHQSAYVDVLLTPEVIGTDTYKLIAGEWLAIPQVFRLVYATLRATCDVTVADRFPALAHYRKTDQLSGYFGAAIVASATGSLTVGSFSVTGSVTFSEQSILGLNPEALIIDGPSDYITMGLLGGVAGDSYYAHLVFKYLNRELGMIDPAEAWWEHKW